MADLYGLRLAVLHESDAGRHLAEGTVKRLTGGDRLKARRMREDFWSFSPTHTFVMLTNHRPVVSGQDEGIWRRLRLVPWDVVITEAERDEDLPDKLALELPAVLAWLVTGYRQWRAHGLGDPDQVLEATGKFRAESDALRRFLDQRCLQHGTVGSTDLFTAWKSWCAAENEEPGSQTAFAGALENKGVDKKKDSAGRMRWTMPRRSQSRRSHDLAQTLADFMTLTGILWSRRVAGTRAGRAEGGADARQPCT